jgi:CHASE2 domain-containing sensor protein
MSVPQTLRRGLIYLLPLALLVIAVGARIAASDQLERLSLFCFDLYQKAAPRQAGDASISIVDIDDKSLNKLGQWPWPRSVVAQLVDRLREAGAAVVAFDIDFAEPDRTSPKSLLPLLAQNGVGTAEAEKLLAAVPDPDRRLAEAIGALPVVTGFILTDHGDARPQRRRPGLRLSATIRSAMSTGFRRRWPTCRSWRSGGRKRLPSTIGRLGSCGSPGPARAAARRQAYPRSPPRRCGSPSGAQLVGRGAGANAEKSFGEKPG